MVGSERAGEVPDAPTEEPRNLDADELEVVSKVVSALRRVRFGTVSLVVQDGKVVQIETAEKFRLR